MTNGASFGELALSNNQPRAATVKCVGPCNFAVFSGADFYKIFRKMESKAFAQKWHFLSDHESLEHLPVDIVQKMSRSFQIKYVKRNQVLYDESMNPENVYFIFSGEYEMSRKYYLDQSKTDK